MKIVIVFLCLSFPILGWGQNTQNRFFEASGRVTSNQSYVFRKEIQHKNPRKITIQTFRKTDKKERFLFAEQIKVVNENTYKIKVKGDIFSKQITRKFNPLSNELFEFTDYENGKVKRSGITSSKIPLIFEGEVTEFYINGTKKSVSVYKNNQLISNKNWLENGEPYIDNIFYSVDKEPSFKEGMGRLHQHVLQTFYDSKIDLSRLSGTLKIGFVVKSDGKIAGVKIDEGINKQIDNLALQAFFTLLGEWTPAKVGNKNVNCYQVFPINFILREYQYDYLELRGGQLYWEIN